MNKKRIITIVLFTLIIFFACKTAVVYAQPIGDNFCEEESTIKVMKLIGYLLSLVKLFVPLIIIIIGSLDMVKAVIGKDEKDLKKQAINLALRIVLGICIFFLPSVIGWALGSISDEANSDSKCMTCVLKPGDC